MNLHDIYLAAILSSNGGSSVDLSDYYSKAEVLQKITEKIAEIIANAPEDFDTLKELSDWITNHEDSAAAMNSAISANTSAISDKVDKVTGKGLSTNDFTKSYKDKLDNLNNYDDTKIKSDISAINTTLGDKIDKIAGKGLSTNDFTDEYKSKVDEAAPLSAVYVTTQINSMVNAKVDKIVGKGLSENDFTSSYKTKLDNLENYDDADIKNEISKVKSQAESNRNTISSITMKFHGTLTSGDLISGSLDDINRNNFNYITQTGQYMYTNSPANRPGPETNGILLVFRPFYIGPNTNTFTYIAQVAIAGVDANVFNSSTYAGVFIRTSSNKGETWSSWRKFSMLT
ncbi:MAG: pyocin knob domain-containing protein [Ruminococcus sp.]|nr:pyocin knob domain-containing protein [Ruminococcus sp.]